MTEAEAEDWINDEDLPNFDRGATEYQDGQDLNVRIMQVEPYEEVVINYRKKR